MSNKIITNLKNNKFVYSTAIQTKYLLNNNKARKNRIGNIVTFHTTRCGSSVVGNMLNQHPDIYWDNEIMWRIKLCSSSIQNNPQKYIEYKMFSDKSKYYGFESIMQHFNKKYLNMEVANYLEILKKLGVTHFINLQRKNYLRKNISNLITAKTRKFQSKQDARLIKVVIPINNSNQENSLIKEYNNLEGYYEKIGFLLEKENSIKLTYEDDILQNPYVAYQKIIDFIGLDSFKPQITLKKQNPFSLTEMIENYDEVEKTLIGTNYEWMLDDNCSS